MREHVLHAIDLGMLGDWEGAKRSLEDLDDPIVPRLISLMTEQQRRERERMEVQAVARHELGNALAIAQANVEAMVDGILEATPERLSGIRDALQTCGVLLEDLKRHYRKERNAYVRIESFDICSLIRSQVDLIGGIADSKNVRLLFGGCAIKEDTCSSYRGDPDRIAHALRHVLLSSVRYTPPGGSIAVDCARPNGDILLTVRTDGAAHIDGKVNGKSVGFSLSSKLVDTVGGEMHLIDEKADAATFLISLPTIQLA